MSHLEAEPKPSAPSRDKKPDAAIYVPKGRQGGNQPQSREMPQSGVDKKPKGRPRYTDKARKYNNKNKKDKKESGDEGVTNGEDRPSSKGGRKEKEEPGVEKESVEQTRTDSSEDVIASHTTTETQQNPQEEEEQEEGDNWDSLFTDDGECLNPHLLEEVENFTALRVVILCSGVMSRSTFPASCFRSLRRRGLTRRLYRRHGSTTITGRRRTTRWSCERTSCRISWRSTSFPPSLKRRI